MTLHIKEGLDLANGQILAVSQGDEFVKGAEELVGILDDFPLIETLACAGDDLGEQMKGVDVLEDVGLTVGDEHHVKLVEGLVDEADIVLLDGGVLGAAVGELGERGEEGFYARSWHLSELSREDSFPSAGANRSREDDLEGISKRGRRRPEVQAMRTILAG